MNRSYRLVFNHRLGVMQVASELAAGRRKNGSGGAAVLTPPHVWRHSLGALVLALSGTLAPPAQARVTITGDLWEWNGQTYLPVSPMTTPSTWDTNMWIFAVGRLEGGTGTLTILNGAKVTGDVIHTAYGDTGKISGSGFVTVSGTKSQMTVSHLDVGNSGTGKLTIEHGGVVNSDSAGIGTNNGANGVATVSGAGSQWIIQDKYASIFVGRNGSGTLEILNEGLVRSLVGLIIGTGSGPGLLNVSTNGVLETKYISSYGMGTLNLNGGILRALESRSQFLSGFSTQTLGNGGAIFDTNGFDIGVSTAFASQAGQNRGLSKLGLGKLTLTGDNSYSGGTTISAGTLQLGNGGTTGSLGSGAVSIDQSAVLAVNRSNSVTLGQVISGSGMLEQAGTGTTTLTANNSYGGGTSIRAGTLQLGNGGITGSLGSGAINIGQGAALAVNRSNSVTLGQVISGSGKLEQAGTGTTTLTANNSYGGGTSIRAGTLQLGNGGITGSLGSGAVNIDQGAVLAVNRSNSVTLGQVISGDGSLLQNGANTTTLIVANTYTGGTTINQGKLALGTGGSLAATGAVNLASNGTTFDSSAASGSQTVGALSGVAGSTVSLGGNALTFGDGSNQTLAAMVTGTGGSLIKNGTGTTVLTGSNTYTGDTTVNGGKLLVGDATQGGSVAGNVQVNTGAALGGSGSIGGNVSVADGATLSSGNSPGTLTVNGDLTLTAASGGNSGTTTVFELGQAGVVGGSSNDLIKVGGNVRLGGTLDATVASAGWYRLINYGTSGSGSVTGQFDSTVLHSSSSFDASQANASVLTTVPKQVNLAVVGQKQTLQLWNGTNGNTWDANTVNWTNNAPTSGITSGWQGSVAVFGTDTGAAPGTVTVSGQQSFDSLQFSSSGYTVAAASSADGLRISPASSSNPQTGIINVESGVSAEISAGIANGTASSLTLVGRGTLTLSGQNSYTGGTTVSNGTLVAASNNALGAGSVAVSGSTSALNVNSGISLSNAVTLSNEATLNNSGTLAATGIAVSGTGGPVTVNNSNGAFINPGAGGTAVNLQGGGTVNNAGSIGSSTANLGVSLQAGGSVDNQAGTTISGGVASLQGIGNTAVTLRNAGTLIGDVQLDSSAANAVTLLAGGRLQGNLNMGTNTGSALVLDGTGGQSYAGAVTGNTTLAGALTKTGTSTWTLDKSMGSGFAPTSTTIADGTLALSGAGTLGSSSSLNLSGSGASLDISAANAGQSVTTLAGVAGSQIHLGSNNLSFGDGSNQSFAGSIDGLGGITKNGAGTQTLSGVNSYTGTTTISAGTVQLGDGTATGQGSIVGNIANNGALVINNLGVTTLAGNISGAGTLTQQGPGTTTLTGTNSYTGGTVVASGTLQAGSAGALTQNSSYYLNQGATLDLNGHALQTSMLQAAGNVQLGSAVLTVNSAAGQTDSLSGQVAGSGHLIKQGSGILNLNGANSFTGGVDLKQGRINLGNAQGLGTGTLSMDDGTMLGLTINGMTIANDLRMTGTNDPVIDTGTNHATWAGAISGTGFLTKQGTGTLTLTSTANNYTGATEVAQGTLQAGAANTFSSTSAHNVAAGAMLDLAGYNQTLASLNNSGMVKLSSNGGGTPGTVLKVTGAYVGNGGTLGLSTVLAADGSATDKLLLSGSNAIASGSTSIQITNAGGLGAQTLGTGIQVVGTESGGSLQPNSFTLAGGHVDAGAFEYRLFQTAQGAALQSTNTQLAYRSEVPLMSALPAQLRQADMAMLGDMHKRMGDGNVQAGNGTGATSADLGQNRRAWGRILRTDPTIRQQGTVSPESSGHMTGFQAGLDLYADQSVKAGIYVGQLDGDMSTTGFAGGINSKYVGFNTLRSRYLGVYGSWQDASGLYADAVLQGADYRSQLRTAANTGANAVTTKGSGWLASLEVGKPFAINSNWQIEPQAQLIYRKISLDDTVLSLATVRNHADDDWTLRLGARIKGNFTTSAGVLQPYARINVYKASSTTDVASFVVPAATTDIKAKGGYTAIELAVGASMQLSKSTSLYGELGKLLANGEGNRVKSGVQASVGVKVQW